MVAKGKLRRTRRRGSAQKSSTKPKVLEIRSAAQIPALESVLSKGPMTLVLVFADWCPACHKFMKNMWKPMCKEQEGAAPASMNRIAVREDLVGKTSLAGSQYKYLPSLMLVGTDKKPAVFDSPEGKTNAMPTPDSLDELKRITQASPSLRGESEQVQSVPIPNVPSVEASSNLSPLEPNAENIRDRIPSQAVGVAQRGGCGCMLQRGGGCGEGSCGLNPMQAHTGGGLYSSLLAAARGAIPASALATMATTVKRPHMRRSRRRRQH
jgi:thiol-disulfide isomerase/thioredoxin